jgi:hypothetical protein
MYSICYRVSSQGKGYDLVASVDDHRLEFDSNDQAKPPFESVFNPTNRAAMSKVLRLNRPLNRVSSVNYPL